MTVFVCHYAANRPLPGHPMHLKFWPFLAFLLSFMLLHAFAFIAWIRIRAERRRLKGGLPLFGATAVIVLFWATVFVRILLELYGKLLRGA